MSTATPAFRPELLTKSIVYCLRHECPKANNCLRYLAYQHSEPFYANSFLDPRKAEIGNECEQYLSNQIIRLAYGFKRAMGSLRYNDLNFFRSRAYYELNCGRSMYYDYASGKRPLTPIAQERIRNIFNELGVILTEYFDRYEEGYFLD